MKKSNRSHRMKIFGVDDMLIGAAIGGLGSIFTNKTNSDNVAATNQANIAMQRETNKMNIEEAARNRDWQERLSNSAYQRGMTDMKQAGLNPILAYQKGGASSPGGAQAALTAAKSESFRSENVAASAVNTAMALRRSHQELENMRETQGQIHASTRLADAQRQNTIAETALKTEDLSPAKTRALLAKLDRDVFDTSAGAVLRRAGTVSQEGKRALDGVHSAKDLIKPWGKSHTSTRSTTRTSDEKGGWHMEDRFNDAFKPHW